MTAVFLRAESDEEVLDLRVIYEASLEIARDRPALPEAAPAPPTNQVSNAGRP